MRSFVCVKQPKARINFLVTFVTVVQAQSKADAIRQADKLFDVAGKPGWTKTQAREMIYDYIHRI